MLNSDNSTEHEISTALKNLIVFFLAFKLSDVFFLLINVKMSIITIVGLNFILFV